MAIRISDPRLQAFISHFLSDVDENVGQGCHEAFEGSVKKCLRWRNINEGQDVDRMHNGRNSDEVSRNATQNSRLALVGMHDIGPDPEKHRYELKEPDYV